MKDKLVTAFEQFEVNALSEFDLRRMLGGQDQETSGSTADNTQSCPSGSGSSVNDDCDIDGNDHL